MNSREFYEFYCSVFCVVICSTFHFQYDGKARRPSRPDFHAKMQRSGSETLLKTDLEQSKEALKIEIRKQLKLKEGAENLKKVATDRKTLTQCNSILKEATAKLQDLHDELQDLNARVSEDVACEYLMF